MGRSKLKKMLKWQETMKDKPVNKEVPIANLPENFLWMHVKSGTKIRNVLGYALKEFPSHNSIVWTGVGHGIAKAISCAELFKRKHEALHQITKLCYAKSEKSKEDEAHRVPEIHILLSKDIKNTSENGYQAPGDCGEFLDKKDVVSNTMESDGNATCIDAEQFAAMGLRIGQKRSKREERKESSSKKSKKSMF